MLSVLHNIEQKILGELQSDFKRYLFDTIDFDSQIIGIVGSRGVGKTTLMLQYLHELKADYPTYKSLYFSYDFPTNTDINLFELAQEFSKVGGKYLLVDEIHRYKNFALDLKAIYDFYPKLKVIFSGSSAISIYNAQADLSRRVVLYHMRGLSYREFLELEYSLKLGSFSLDEIVHNSVEIVNRLQKEFVPLEHFDTYLTFGYYPFYFRDKNQYLKLLSAIINQIIEVDFVSMQLVKPSFVNKLKKLLVIISESEPFELNISKVASNLEVSRNTVYTYLNYLERGDLINVVYDDKKGITKLSKPEKLYLNNTNLFYVLSSQNKIGTIRETFFVSMLKQNHSITTTKRGDFIVDNRYTIEVGGPNKSFEQIKGIPNSYLAIDTDSTHHPQKIPLWLFGFLY